MQKKPLNGIRVLDLTRLLPGPLCTFYLARFGAHVIKIEEPKTGDYLKTICPRLFSLLNKNKRIIKIDLNTKKGKDIFYRLCKKAHVLVEGFRPGVVKKLGIDYKAVKKINPKIIYCSISGYGQTGPCKNKSGHDLNYISYAGIIDPRNPFIPNFQIADIIGALNATISILAALFKKQRQFIDVSLLESVSALNVCGLSGLDMLTGKYPFYNIYKTRDKKYISIAALEQKFQKRLCDSLSLKKLNNNNLSNIFKTKTQSQWINHFKNVDCCFTPVLSLKEALKKVHKS